MKSYNKLIVAVVLTLVVPMIALVVIRSMAPDSVFEDESLVCMATDYAKFHVWSELPEAERPYTPDLRPDLSNIAPPADLVNRYVAWLRIPREKRPYTSDFRPDISGVMIATTTTGTFTTPRGVELVKPGLSKPVQDTPINMAAFYSRPDLAQRLRNLPPGTKVPLIGTSMDGLPNPVEWATGMSFKPSQFYGGLTTDNTGQVYYADGRPAGPELGQFIQASITIGRGISQATADVGQTFDETQAGTAARRGQSEDRIFSVWSDTTLGIDHFIWRGEEYEVDSFYTHAIGPDDLLYRAEDASHFNSNFRVIDPNRFYRQPEASY